MHRYKYKEKKTPSHTQENKYDVFSIDSSFMKIYQLRNVSIFTIFLAAQVHHSEDSFKIQ